MPRPKSPDRYYKRIASHGLEATIKERSNGRLYLTGMIAGERIRKSLETEDRAVAESRARETLAGIQRRLLRVEISPSARGTDVTLGEVLETWRKLKKADYSATAGRSMDQRASFLCRTWGAGTPVSHLDQDDVDNAARAVLRRDNVQSKTTARLYLADTSSILNWATRKKREGVPLLQSNPLAGLRFPGRDPNGRAPVASHERFLTTLRFTRGLPTFAPGALGTALTIARYQGRRLNSIRQLQHHDVCLSQEALRQRLAELHLSPVIAKFWKHGAMVWRAETDKEERESIVPLHPVTARAIRYHQRRLRRQGHSGRWLFASPVNTGSPLTPNALDRLLRKAEERARNAGADVPDLKRGCWHPYRRLWRAERAEFRDKVVAFLGGWKWHNDGWAPAMNAKYLPVHPKALAEAIEVTPACCRDSIDTADDLLWHFEGLETQW